MDRPRVVRRQFFAHFKQLKIAERYGLAAVFLILAVLAGLGAFLQWRIMLREKESYVRLANQAKLNQIEGWYDSQLIDAEEILSTEAFLKSVNQAVAMPTTQNLNKLHEFLWPLFQSNNYANCELLDVDFHKVYALTEFTHVDQELLLEKISTRKKNSPFFTNIHLISPSTKPGFHLVVPLTKSQGSVVFSYIVITYYADEHLYPMLENWPGKEASGETILLQRAGTIIQNLNPLKLVNIAPFSLQISATSLNTVEAQAINGQTGIFLGRDYRGKEVIAASDSVPHLGWILLSKVDFADALSTWIPTLVIIIVFVLLAFAGTLAASYVIFSSRTLSLFQTRLALFQRLERSEAILKAILERIDVPVVLFNESFAIEFANRAFKSRFGDTLPCGLPPPQSFSAEDFSTFAQEFELTALYGKLLHVHVRGLQITTEGQPKLFGYLMRDVTELESALAQVQQLNKQLSQKVEAQTKQILKSNEELRSIASAISHNLASPLRAVESFSELLEARVTEKLDSEAMDYILRIRRASTNMTSLTDDLVTYLSLDSRNLASQDIDFSLMAQEILSEYIKRDPNRRYEIVIMPGLKMHGDASLFKIALRNAIENALLYCSDSMVAKIEIGKYGEFGIYIKDNGIGMSKSEINAVLKLVPDLESDDYMPGFGVGLAITKKIIERHGGQLEIESKEREGTVVRFKF